MKRSLVHAVGGEQDAEMAMALGHPVTAICGKRWVPTRYGDAETKDMPPCPACFPKPKERAPRLVDKKDHPHYVYRCFDADGRLVYVGCTNNPVNRMRSHRRSSWWGDQVHSVRLIVFPNREYALLKEREAIGEERPRWNVKGRWPYREDAWALEDYSDFRYAISQAIETTHGIYTENTYKLIREVEAEAHARFGVRLMARRPA